MLRTGHSLGGMDVYASDGVLGHVVSLRFDDETWQVTDLVVRAGMFAQELRVVPVHFVASVGLSGGDVRLEVDIATVKDQQPETQRITVGSQREHPVHQFYRRGYYWTHVGNPHLRDSEETWRATIHCTDAVEGWLDDFVIDTEHWRIAGLVVELGKHLDEETVLVPTAAVERIGWDVKGIWLSLSDRELHACEAFDRYAPVNPGNEEFANFDYLGMPRM